MINTGILSLIIAIIALFTSVYISWCQKRIMLFQERYKIYNRFKHLINRFILLDDFENKSELYKELWTYFLFGNRCKSFYLSERIKSKKQQLVKYDEDSAAYNILRKEIDDLVLEKFREDSDILDRDRSLLIGAKIFFSDKVYIYIDEFSNWYFKLILSTVDDKENFMYYFFEMKKVSDKVISENILEKMEKEMRFDLKYILKKKLSLTPRGDTE